MAYVDFYDIAGSYDAVKQIAGEHAPGALVREDAFQREGYGEVHRVYITAQEQRTALNRVTADCFPTKV
jgi:hypothetical protein